MFEWVLNVPVLCASVYFASQPFLRLSCLWLFNAFSFCNFLIFHETYTPALQLATTSYCERLVTSSSLLLNDCGIEVINIRPYVLSWCPNIKKMKAHEVCILWGLLNLSSISYEKNIHGNKNDDIFSTVHSCPTCHCKIST